jgi:hypothetical protein
LELQADTFACAPLIGIRRSSVTSQVLIVGLRSSPSGALPKSPTMVLNGVVHFEWKRGLRSRPELVTVTW